ncbi:protease [Brachyspira hampsonii]|uniref:Protease n=1 Tax=Brachyspira hampsonii TaxID=1287055 RepID=A0A1E5NCM1_9SPIR|nr:type 1 glutamine amidotransferase domain-containing protein [Brachyspira hampsonii]OEJ13914.1 protease [Brachyspira hampsonii]
MKALIITDNFFEDSELFYPYFRLIEEGIDVDIAALNKGEIKGEYFFKTEAKLNFSEVDPSNYKALIIPGGRAPEAIRGSDDVKRIIKYFVDNNLTIGAICHGQQTLISAKVLEGKDATCYIGIRDDLMNAKANYKDEKVVVCGNIVTSRCPDDLPYFAKEIIKKLK